MPLDVRSRLSRSVQRMAASPRFAAIAPRIIPKVDRFLVRITGGRFMTSAGIVPSLLLVSTGAKSGQRRETPLATLPAGDDFYVVASNFARPAHPAWSYNLLAHPEATVLWKGRHIPVRARLLDDDEKAAVWPDLTAIWPTYDTYEERTERDLRVFRLEAVT